MRLRALFIVCSGLIVLSSTLRASAQSIRLSVSIERRADRPPWLELRTINWDDCQAGTAGDELRIPLTVTGGSGFALEVWSGTSPVCSELGTRGSAGLIPDQCWQVWSRDVAESSTVALNVRDILPHGDSGFGSGLTDACNTAAATGEGAGTVTLFFGLVAGNTSFGQAATLALKYDVKGPPAPIATGVEKGDTRLYPSFSAREPPDLEGYRLYCEPADSEDPDSCTASALSAGEVPLTAQSRGQTSSSATIGEVQGLSNGQRYACGVSGYDTFGNAGPLSNLVCEVPEPAASPEVSGPELTGRCEFGRTPSTPTNAATLLALVASFSSRRARRRR